jgi:hypothetical protein
MASGSMCYAESIIWGLYNRPEVATVPSGLSPTPLIIIIIIIITESIFGKYVHLTGVCLSTNVVLTKYNSVKTRNIINS